MKKKVCVVVTARPSYSRIKTALREISNHPDLELQLVVAASALLDKYGNPIAFIEKDGFKPAAKVYMVLEGENLVTMAKTTGLGLLELPTVFDNLQPDIVVTIADRFETISTAITASYMNIPVVHIQGGEVTGSIDEKVRHAVTKLSNYHFVATEKAAERVRRMGEEPDTVHVTGCPSIDLAQQIRDNPQIDLNLLEKYGVGPKLDLSKDYFVVLQHPVTTESEQARKQIDETLYAAKSLDRPVLWFWPNVDAGSDGTSKGIRSFRENERPENIHFFKNLSSTDFLKVLYFSQGIIGNSSVAIRECSYLGVPAVNIGSRQQGRERGRNVVDVDYDREQIRKACQKHLKGRLPEGEGLYGDGASGKRIAGLLAEIDLKRIEKRLTY
jgi:UDP-hydrolysing UDP-N-acetyl-D-glucosamine 2-epimerase